MSQINLLTNERIVDRTNTEYYNALRTNIQFLGKDIKVPFNYYPNDDDTKTPQNTWRGVAYLFYHNWINQVYQLTPYDLKELAK